MASKPLTGNYRARVIDVLNIYSAYCGTGLSNKYIWKHYIYPKYYISERTFYNYLKRTPDLL
jgi:hypothetical protein